MWGTQFHKRNAIPSKIPTDRDTVLVSDFSSSLSPADGPSRQKLNKETLEFEIIINQMGLTDIYRVFHQTLKKTVSSQQPMDFL